MDMAITQAAIVQIPRPDPQTGVSAGHAPAFEGVFEQVGATGSLAAEHRHGHPVASLQVEDDDTDDVVAAQMQQPELLPETRTDVPAPLPIPAVPTGRSASQPVPDALRPVMDAAEMQMRPLPDQAGRPDAPPSGLPRIASGPPFAADQGSAGDLRLSEGAPPSAAPAIVKTSAQAPSQDVETAAAASGAVAFANNGPAMMALASTDAPRASVAPGHGRADLSSGAGDLIAEGRTEAPGLRLVAGLGQPLSLPKGMPAYWAAREAAEQVGESGGDAPADAGPVPPAKAGGATPAPPIAALPTTPAAQPAGPDAPAVTDEVLPDGDLPLAVPTGPSAAPAPGAATMTTAGNPASSLPPALPAQIAAALAARSERPVELRMTTEELGGLLLRLQQDGNEVHVALLADRGDTLDLLRRNGGLLIEELRAAGFSDATLSFGEGSGSRDRTMPEPHLAAADPPPVPPVTPDVLLLTAALRVASGAGLDVRF